MPAYLPAIMLKSLQLNGQRGRCVDRHCLVCIHQRVTSRTSVSIALLKQLGSSEFVQCSFKRINSMNIQRQVHECLHRFRDVSTGQASDRTHKTSPKDIRYRRDSGASSELGVHCIQEVTEKLMGILLPPYTLATSNA